MSQEALNRPLCTWSVHGVAIWDKVSAGARTTFEGVMKDLGLTVEAVTLESRLPLHSHLVTDAPRSMPVRLATPISSKAAG